MSLLPVCFRFLFGVRGICICKGDEYVLAITAKGYLVASGGGDEYQCPTRKEVDGIAPAEFAGSDGGAVVLRNGERQASV